ncbi:MAG: class F sortase [bacterium]|nr:class F sortase [bacterium]
MITIILVVALCVALFFHFNAKAPVHSDSTAATNTAVASSKPAQTSPGLPLRLQIPAIAVDAAIESVGITPKGEMDVPKNPANAAWYNRGPRPGEKGSSVIDGHYGYKGNVPAVFDNLSKLQKGDKLYVRDVNGMTNTFVVRVSRNYDPKADASGVFLSSDGKAHLNLITCEGVWDKTKNSFSSRLVVFTDKE